MAYTFTRTGAQIEEIHNTVEDPKSNAQFSDDIRTIAGEYRGLWPDTGGSANKGDTYQTQVSGTPTGQYFTALQNTTVDPVGDDVNWRMVVSEQWVADNTDITFDSISDVIAYNNHRIGSKYSLTNGTKLIVSSVSNPFTIQDLPVISEKLYSRDFNVRGDYYLQDGSVNPSPTNDSQQIKDMLNHANGKECIIQGGVYIPEGVAIDGSTERKLTGVSDRNGKKSGFFGGSLIIGNEQVTKKVEVCNLRFNPLNATLSGISVGWGIFSSNPPVADEIIAKDCEFTFCKYGISGGSKFKKATVTGNRFFDIGDSTTEQFISAIRLGNENDNDALHGSDISGNEFLNIQTGGGECHAVFIRGRDYNVTKNQIDTVVNNRFTDGNGGEGIYASGEGYKVIGNTCIDAGIGGEGAIAAKGGGGAISSNIIKHTDTYSDQTYNGIYLGSPDNTIDGNVIKGHTGRAVYADNCDSSTITDNVCDGVGGLYLIQVLGAGMTNVSGNTVITSKEPPIFFRPASSDSTLISNNQFTFNLDQEVGGDVYCGLVQNLSSGVTCKSLSISGNSFSIKDPNGYGDNYWPLNVNISGVFEDLTIISNPFSTSSNVTASNKYGVQFIGSGVNTNPVVSGNGWQEIDTNYNNGRYTPVIGERIYPPSLLFSGFIGYVHTGSGDKWQPFGAITT